MARILIRDLEETVKDRLQRRAVRHGRSMEAEVRDILRDVVKDDDTPSAGLGRDIAQLFAQDGLDPQEILPELRGHRLCALFNA